MIHVTWVDPNFEVEIEDRDGVRLTEIHYAPDQTVLQARLDRRVAAGTISRVHAIRPYDFARWQRRAANALEAARKKYDEGKLDEWEPNSGIWAELKPYLIQLFHQKCAYCEASFGHVSFGDVEHYRPKKKVTDEHGVEVVCDGAPHPGYFWLAYEPSNLFPSCQLCNQALAKMNRFPITGVRVWAPDGDLEAEDPLLLNPYADRPDRDVRFVPTMGTVGGVTPRGEVSARVYRLNREMLIEKRRDAQNHVRRTVKEAFFNEKPAEIVEIRRQCADGEREFSQAALSEINSYFATMGITLP